MPIYLYDTKSRSNKLLLQPKDRKFYFYCCGPTVYGPAHIGNFRTFIIQDTLRRILELANIQLKHVRNITDVDDKTIKQSQIENKELKEFTEYWISKFKKDCDLLNLLPPHEEPKALDHIKEQINIIKKLIKKGNAYADNSGSVYFSVKSYEKYGSLNQININQLCTQSTNSSGEVNTADEYDRESVNDFALWKSRKPEDGDNFWESPWGEGRPGWHLECSAMVHSSFDGKTIDLHGGGIDLCFPHHENEIAQSESAFNKPFCNHWFHSAHLKVEGEKMSKSLGNLYTVDDLINKGISPVVIRYTLISSSYRQPLNFTFKGLSASESALKKIECFVEKFLNLLSYKKENYNSKFIRPHKLTNFFLFQNAWDELCNNINTSSCLGEIFKIIRSDNFKNLTNDSIENNLKSLGSILYALGLKLFEIEESNNYKDEVPEDIKELATKRWEAKLNKNYKFADELRTEIKNAGWEIEDGPNDYIIKSIK